MLSPSFMCLYLLCLFHNLVLSTSSSFLSYDDNNSSSDQWLCHEDEYYALLTFKQSFTFTLPKLLKLTTAEINSWKNGTDCCEWEGITCHPLTHHVIVLNLYNNGIVGNIHSNSTLFHLRHLQVIILSWNDFSSSSISPDFGHFHFLKHLDLSKSRFLGTVPFEIGQLSQLIYLDLSLNEGLKFPNSKMIISNLTKLRTLNLSVVNLNLQRLQSITNLSSLKYIELSNCSLGGELPASILSLPHLRRLDLGLNDLTFPSTPSLFFNRSWSSHLEYLDLTSSNFSSNIPSFLSQLPYLKILVLSNCSLRGSIPDWLWNTPEFIDLRSNELTGSLPSKVNTSKLLSLTYLNLSSNLLVGEVPSWLFRLESLEVIDLSYNQLRGNISLYDDVISNFPNLWYVSLSSSGLSVTLNTNVPVDSTLTNSLNYLYLSNTSICGEFPKWFQKLVKESLINILDISHNMLTGHLPYITSAVAAFDASYNKFIGPIDSSFCNLTSLWALDLSNNNLSGNFPHCWGSQSKFLSLLHLGSNNIHGTLPTNLGSMFSSLLSLNLSSNLLEGQIPQSLAKCSQLQAIDFKGNKLVGEFPIFLHTLPNLELLDLSSNRLHGPIINVNQKNPFSKLQILDLSNNNFSGKIPIAYIKNFKAMMRINNKHLGGPQYLGVPQQIIINISNFHLHFDWPQSSLKRYSWGGYFSIMLKMKGVDLYYEKINGAMYDIDLSNNGFEGEIPECIGQLVAIKSLNLSYNHLKGYIPPSTGDLWQLESLDLSSNMLTGHIPQELVSLDFSVFNVSNNQLAGRIPAGTNMDARSANSYKGNPELCGPPLHDCGSVGTPIADNTGGSQDGSEDELSMWEIVIMGFGTGVVVGLAWGYCMLTLERPLWFAQLPDKMVVLLLHCRDGAFGRLARITTRN